MENAAFASTSSDRINPPDSNLVGSSGAGAWRAMPLEGAFQFSYRDASGRRSLRRLIVHDLKVGPGKMLLGGTDLGTGAYRGFRVDRIHFLEDAETGRIVDRNLLDWLMDLATRQERARRRAAVVEARERRRTPLLASSTER